MIVPQKAKDQRHSKKIQLHGKTPKYEGMRRTSWYAGLAERSQAMSEDAVQRSRWTFYEVVNNGSLALC